MSITVEFWGFSKRPNSTKVPEIDPARFDGVLRDGCDILTPVIKFKLDTTPTYNYCRIAAFGNRYYTVRSWRWVNGLWECELAVDVLASWKSQIQNTRAYITRSSAQYDGNISDGLFPAKPEWKHLRAEGSQPFLSGPYYIVQYAGKTGSQAVLLSPVSFNTLCTNLWRTLNGVEGMTAVIANVVDPFQFVTGVQATPANANFWNSAGDAEIILGALNTGVSGAVLTGEGGAQYGVSVPKHPQSSGRPFLKGSPYSSYMLKAPGVGIISLNADDLYNESSLSIQYQAEPYSGNLRVEVYGSRGIIASATGKITSQWALGSNAVSITGALSGIAGLAASGAIGNFIGAGSGIIDAALSMIPAFEQVGSPGGAVGMYEPIELILRYREVVPDDLAEQGRPLMQMRSIYEIPGFIKCAKGDHSIPCTKSEALAISNAFTEGFYYE